MRIYNLAELGSSEFTQETYQNYSRLNPHTFLAYILNNYYNFSLQL